MSHTIRAYNKAPLRLGPGYRGWIVSNRIPEQDLFRFMVGDYHPWQQWGSMKGWRDWRLRSRRRQAWKAEVRLLSEEYAFGEMSREYESIEEMFEDLEK